MYIVVGGPDGTGKSTVVGDLTRAAESGQVRIFHHRPHVLGRLSAVEDIVTEPHRSEPYPRWLSTAKLLFLFADFLIGWVVKMRPWLRSGGDIVFERGWWDLLVDPARYRLRPAPRLISQLGRLVPRPDVIIVLGGDAEVIAARKGELPVAETARQLHAWANLPRAAGRTVTVDAVAPMEDMLAAVRAAARRSGSGQRWVLLPNAAAPRWYLPATPARAAVNALQLYQPVTTRGRLGWEAARVVAAAGGFRLLARDTEPPRGVLQALTPHVPSGTRLAVAHGSHVGRSTALMLDGRSGEPLTFAKIARDDGGPAALAAEAAIGERLASFLPPGLNAPKVLHAEEGLLLFEAVIGRPRSQPWWLPPEVAFLLGRFHRAGASDDGLGPAHGDCAPWNLLHTKRGWFLVDWAEGRTDTPPFEDVFHYLVQAHALLGRPGRPELVAAFAGRGRSGAIVRSYAEGAGLAVEDALGLAPSYLERSAVGLDPAKRDGRDGLRARAALLEGLANFVRP